VTIHSLSDSPWGLVYDSDCLFWLGQNPGRSSRLWILGRVASRTMPVIRRRTQLAESSRHRQKAPKCTRAEYFEVSILVGSASLGISLAQNGCRVVSISEGGAVHSFNCACPQAQLQAGDEFVEVNGVSIHTATQFGEVCRLQPVMLATVRRHNTPIHEPAVAGARAITANEMLTCDAADVVQAQTECDNQCQQFVSLLHGMEDHKLKVLLHRYESGWNHFGMPILCDESALELALRLFEWR